MCSNDIENDTFLDILTLGLIKKLKQTEGISSLNVEKRVPCNRLSICAWEQSNYTSLPIDLREFYASTDGFSLTWKYQSSGEKNLRENVTLGGEIKVSSLSNLRRLHFVHRRKLNQRVFQPDKADRNVPVFADAFDNCSDQNYDFSTAFILSYHQNVGAVCLIYHNEKQTVENSSKKTEPSSSVWLLDIANGWHFLAKDFSTYFRMMLVHLGIDSWQLRFTSAGLTYHCQRVMAKLLPHVFAKEDGKLELESEIPRNIINANIFKMGFVSKRGHSSSGNKKTLHRNRKK